MFNPILKMRETLLLFLSVVINGLICTRANIRLDTFKIKINSIFISK